MFLCLADAIRKRRINGLEGVLLCKDKKGYMSRISSRGKRLNKSTGTLQAQLVRVVPLPPLSHQLLSRPLLVHTRGLDNFPLPLQMVLSHLTHGLKNFHVRRGILIFHQTVIWIMNRTLTLKRHCTWKNWYLGPFLDLQHEMRIIR